MGRVRCLLGRILHPGQPLRALVPSLSFALLFFVFESDRTHDPLAYCVYVLSAYSLVVLILWLPELAGRLKRELQETMAKSAIVRCLAKNDLFRRYAGDLAFRGNISIYLSTAVNFINVVFRAVAGVLYASPWFISMAVYYLVLGVLRAYLAYCYRVRSDVLEVRCYRFTARALFLLDIPMGGMIILMVFTDSGFAYPGSVIYLSALYAFYAMGISFVNLFKYRRVGSPILSAAKVLNVVSAMMSILGLQTAMIAQFSHHDESFRMMMNAITGGFVYAITIAIAIYMLVRVRSSNRSVDIG